ncbi:MAG TPA: non-heme iron oxygenase ferredoxin subunit [Gaiella sp.]|uniref:Rieske (2Fe-2S) protein n=1 Tax=Gaiella sp. TaxID=2663207 RepID=UPI002D7E7BB0|nr:non-heme iron oxygenase ferredoxin subunit [Gaiella sp.]HET9285992.1 non-heme iron oxygenase ferredoxin subunit [Gaiella sp.]
MGAGAELEVEALPLEELPDGTMRLIAADGLTVGLYHCGGELHAIEDRCSHDDGPLCEGEWDSDACQVVCPRHGSRFDLRSGSALTLPAYVPVATYPVRVRADGMIVIDVGRPSL